VKANAEVRHSIKVILRVERIGEEEGNEDGGKGKAKEKEKEKKKGKKWDIVVQVGFDILSVSFPIPSRSSNHSF
jgi:hypothetical protein